MIHDVINFLLLQEFVYSKLVACIDTETQQFKLTDDDSTSVANTAGHFWKCLHA